MKIQSCSRPPIQLPTQVQPKPTVRPFSKVKQRSHSRQHSRLPPQTHGASLAGPCPCSQPILLFLLLKLAEKSFHSCSSAPVMGCTALDGTLPACCCAWDVEAGQLSWRASLLLRQLCSYCSLFCEERLEICMAKLFADMRIRWAWGANGSSSLGA